MEVDTAAFVPSVLLQNPCTAKLSLIPPNSPKPLGTLGYLAWGFQLWWSCTSKLFYGSVNARNILYFPFKQGWGSSDCSVQAWELQCLWEHKESVTSLWPGQVKNLLSVYLLMYLLLWFVVIWQNWIFSRTQLLKTALRLKSEGDYSTKSSPCSWLNNNKSSVIIKESNQEMTSWVRMGRVVQCQEILFDKQNKSLKPILSVTYLMGKVLDIHLHTWQSGVSWVNGIVPHY